MLKTSLLKMSQRDSNLDKLFDTNYTTEIVGIPEGKGPFWKT